MTASTQSDFDVLIVGAGVSGVGIAWHLQNDIQGSPVSYCILDQREAVGGTWDLFRYPGIRSDSDLHTLGFAFKPWKSKQSIADAPIILEYLNETVDENDIRRNIRFGHKVCRAEWSSEDALWTVEAVNEAGGTVTLTARWLLSAAGYYSYDKAWAPEFEGEAEFAGPIVLPQFWPEDLDYTGRKVVVIGSGATAVTVVPAMAQSGAEHVTMLQRSPTYVMSVPKNDPVANFIKRVLPGKLAYGIVRRKNIFFQKVTFSLSQKHPDFVRKFIRRANIKALPDGFAVDTHFKPDYNPWDQRLCSVPDGDLFEEIKKGRVSVATDHIDRFTPDGILLKSGAKLEADIVVKATGLNVVPFGGIETKIDGEDLVLNDHLAYRGLMVSDVPNFAYSIGYTNSSWTLKVDIIAEYLCRVLDHMDRFGFAVCKPVNDDPSMETRPLLDFKAGYVQRVINDFPREGDREPWSLKMNFLYDRKQLRTAPIEDGLLQFSKAGAKAPAGVA